ncbi:hypothetical protein, partial [Prauserella cavernicola]|uniref:hypothetical protein n=1 Tax=Prauserella cavernicola TaxID=2800127 RepID=UPI001E4649DC
MGAASLVIAGGGAALAGASANPATGPATAVDLGDPLGLGYGHAQLVNDRGLVAGSTQSQGYSALGWVWQNGSVTQIPGSAQPKAMNNAGVV